VERRTESIGPQLGKGYDKILLVSGVLERAPIFKHVQSSVLEDVTLNHIMENTMSQINRFVVRTEELSDGSFQFHVTLHDQEPLFFTAVNTIFSTPDQDEADKMAAELSKTYATIWPYIN
jgi:hypothetical protein